MFSAIDQRDTGAVPLLKMYGMELELSGSIISFCFGTLDTKKGKIDREHSVVSRAAVRVFSAAGFQLFRERTDV